MPADESIEYPSASLLVRNLTQCIVAVLGATVLFCPLAMGAYAHGDSLWWAEAVFVASATLLAGLLAVRLRVDRSFRAPRGAIPVVLSIVAFVGLVLLQLAPTGWLVKVVSPAAASVRAELLTDVLAANPRSFAVASAAGDVRMSLYPHETARHLRLLLAVTAVFLATLCVTQSRTVMRRVLWLACAAGAVVAGVALLHHALGWDKIYNVIVSPAHTMRTAPMVNHSHFAQFMNLSIGAALALAFGAIASFAAERPERRQGGWIEMLGTRENLGRLALPVVTLLLAVPAVVLSGSRGGLLSMGVAAVLTAAAACARPKLRGVAAIAMVLIVVVGAVVVTSSAHVQSRIAALSQTSAGADRISLLKSQSRIWADYPVVGTGLGTFEWVFAQHDTTRPINIATHAENEYAQLMTETGIVGVLIALVFLVMVGRAYGKAVGTGGRRGAKTLGLGYGLIAILVHSATDFGQHVPANAAVTAILTACVVNCAASRREEAHPVAGRANGLWSKACRLGALVLAAGLVFCTWHADLARRASAASFEPAYDLLVAGKPVTPVQVDAVLAATRRAVDLQPCDANRLYRLGLAQAAAAATRAVGEREPLLKQALDTSLLACATCPTFGPPYSVAGQILRAGGDRARGERLIELASRLAPQDGVSAQIVGEIRLARGDVDGAIEAFRRAQSTAGVGEGEIVEYLLSRPDGANVAVRYAGGRWELLAVIVQRLSDLKRPQEAESARQAWLAVLRREVQAENASAAALREMGRYLARSGNRAESIQYWNRAMITVRPTPPLEWRLEFARLLSEDGQFLQAIAQVQAVLDERPTWNEARALLADLETRARGK